MAKPGRPKGSTQAKKTLDESKRPDLQTKEELIRYLESHPETEPPFYEPL